MSDFDTGDIVVHTPSATVYMVACVHDDVIRTAGYPEMLLGADVCVLKEKATERQFRDALSTLAQSTSTNHRPECARQRLGAIHTEECYYGC